MDDRYIVILTTDDGEMMRHSGWFYRADANRMAAMLAAFEAVVDASVFKA